MIRRDVLAIIVIIVAVVAGLTAYMLVAAPHNKAESLISCKEPSLIYVYATDKQRELGDRLLNFFTTVMKMSGVDLSNYTKCFISSKNLSKELRVYPSILFKGNITPVLRHYVSNLTDDLKILNPVVSLALLRYLNIEPTYTYHANAIIVLGQNPLAKIAENKTLLKKTISLIAIANIDKISYTSIDNAPLKPKILPYLILESDYNLSEDVNYIEHINGKYFKIADRYALGIAFNVLGARGVDIFKDITLPVKPISIGSSNAPLKLYIFEDMWCPYCAKFYYDNEKLIRMYINNGTLELNIVDFVVHSDAVEIHALLKCAYNLTKDEQLYLDLITTLYRQYAHNSSKIPTYNRTLSLIKASLPEDKIKVIKDCVPAMARTVVFETKEVRESLRIQATPTLIIMASKHAVMIEGYLNTTELENIVTWLLEHASR